MSLPYTPATHSIGYKGWRMEAYVNTDLLRDAQVGDCLARRTLRRILYDSFANQCEGFEDRERVVVWNLLEFSEIPSQQARTKDSFFMDDLLVPLHP